MVSLLLQPHLYSHPSNGLAVVNWAHMFKPFCSRMTETTSGWLCAMAMWSGVCRATPRVSSGKAFWVWRLGLAPCWSSSAVKFARPQRQAVWRGLSPWKYKYFLINYWQLSDLMGFVGLSWVDFFLKLCVIFIYYVQFKGFLTGKEDKRVCGQSAS